MRRRVPSPGSFCTDCKCLHCWNRRNREGTTSRIEPDLSPKQGSLLAIYATSSAHQKLPLRLLEGSCCALVSFGTRTSGTMCPELFINEPAEQVSKCRLIVI